MKAKRRKSVGSEYFKLKFRADERRVNVRPNSREFSQMKREPVLEEVAGLMTEPRYLKSFSNRVDISRSDTVKGMGSAEPEIIEREEHLVGLSFRFIVEARSVRRFIRRWCMRLFEVIILKLSTYGRLIKLVF